MLDITSTLVRDTQRVNVGQMVGCSGYRHPVLYAKMASTVDVAAHGRLYAGTGAGWYEHEWRAYGFEWPELRDRMGAFREAVEIIHRMWTEDDVVFHGRYYAVDRPINEPRGARRPHPSFWIGGGGPNVTLKLVAQYGDACNVGGGDPEKIREKLAILEHHCETVSRDYAEIIKSTSLNLYPIADGADPVRATERVRGGRSLDEFSRDVLVGFPKDIAARIDAIIAAGADYIVTYIPGVAYDHEPLHRFADEVVPAFA